MDAPSFTVDPLWPKPLPNHWILGSTIGVGVDSKDHVFIIHRGFPTLTARTEAGLDTKPPTGECCAAAPPILEFDPEGNLVKAWGGPGEGFVWPISNHGISIDHKDNVWIGGNGNDSTGRDSHVLKFTHDGRFLMQFGTPNQRANSSSTEHFGRVAKISFDPAANEAYFSDGYGNKRVAVIDMDNGKIKRFWGAYGKAPSDSSLGTYNPDAPLAQQFRNPVHCAEPSNDGFVYVCDRPNNRIQVFRKDGSFVKEQRIAPRTGRRAVWDIGSRGPQKSHLSRRWEEQKVLMDRQSGTSPASATVSASPASSSACTASPLIRRATSTPPRPTKESASRNSSIEGSSGSPLKIRAWYGPGASAGSAPLHGG